MPLCLVRAARRLSPVVTCLLFFPYFRDYTSYYVIMPVNRKTFYSKKLDTSDTSEASTSRWAGRRKFTSSVVIPPSEPVSSSACLSLPSGMSPPRGSPSTSPEPETSLVQSFAKPVISTRFTNALHRNNQLQSLCPAAQPADPKRVSPSKRCISWLQQDSGV